MATPLPLIAFDTLADQTEALYRDGYAYLPNVLMLNGLQNSAITWTP